MKIHQTSFTEAMKQETYAVFAKYDKDKMGVVGIDRPISYHIRNGEEIVSSVITQHFWGALHIKYVWTKKEHRGKGYATKILEVVLRIAKEKKYPFIFIETLSFQALDFYKKFGFEVEFIRQGFSHDISFYYLRKTLT